ncbi:MAG: cytochrome d ubiquinol oxidase subunit II [Chloroflexi bacterium]|nr:cytochrome d ubiquinol oxidase subunit II [Chloroflexota bacterium]
MSLPYVLLSILWLALIVYTVLGGADFGAGMLELFAFGPTGVRQGTLIDESLDPVWEANHVWLIFLLVVFFTTFPPAFAAINVILFIPLMLAVIGIVLRGSAFAFRVHGTIKRNQTVKMLSRIFSIASAMTPFFLAVAAAAIASGRIQIQGKNLQTNLGSYWLTPFALTIGAMALTLCVTIAAIYLTVEATNKGDTELAEVFRQRGLIAGALTAALGVLGLILAPTEAPILWHGMLDHALFLAVVIMLIGLATAAALFLRHYQVARILIIGEAAFLLGTWGVSQIPYLIPPDVTVASAASSQSTMLTLFIGIIIGLIIIGPSFWFLFHVFKTKPATRPARYRSPAKEA